MDDFKFFMTRAVEMLDVDSFGPEGTVNFRFFQDTSFFFLLALVKKLTSMPVFPCVFSLPDPMEVGVDLLLLLMMLLLELR